MDPVSIGITAVGLGMSIMGGMKKAETARQTAAVSQQMAQTEMQQNAVRRRAMEVAARRQQMEVLRNQQRARSLALANATSQGAQFGSGLSGGYGQIAGQTNWNLAGISEGLNSGRQMFDLDAQLGGQKMQMAQLGGQAATAQGIMSLGGSFLQSAEPAGRLAKQFGTGFGGGASP